MRQITIIWGLVLWFPYFQSLSSINSHQKPNLNLQSFMVNLIHNKFAECTLLFLRDEDSETLNSILINLRSQFYNIKYYKQNNQSETLQPELPVYFKNPVKTTNKRGDRCKFVILMLNDIRPEFLTQIFRTITPVYIPITQKDVDHYVFITRPQLVDTLLLTYELPARVKYKIGIGQGDTDFFVRSVCFFCDDGHESVLQFPKNFHKEFDYFPDYLKNLNGRTLRISAPAVLSTIQVRKPWSPLDRNNAERGNWKDLFDQYLMLKFNFTYNIFLSSGKDGKFGAGGTGFELPNGSWVGIVGDVAEGKADIGIVTGATPKRVQQVTFTNSFFEPVYLTFLTSHGSRIFSPLALLWPFDLLMWLLIFLSTLLCFLFFTFLTKAMTFLGVSSAKFTRRGKVSHDLWTFSHQIQFVIQSFLDQDSVIPESTPLRCFVALWLFFVLIITTIYRSKMVSLLAYPLIEQVPDTFEALSRSGYSVGFMKHGDAAYNTLKASKDPVYVKLLSRMEIITGVGLECMERVVLREKYACIAYNVSATYLNARNFSVNPELQRKLVFSPASTFVLYLGLTFEGGSIYKEGFDKALSWTRPFHLPSVWKERDLKNDVRKRARDWYKSENRTETKEVEINEDDLTLKHVSGSFYAVGFGLGMATIVFLGEIRVIRW